MKVADYKLVLFNLSLTKKMGCTVVYHKIETTDSMKLKNTIAHGKKRSFSVLG